MLVSRARRHCSQPSSCSHVPTGVTIEERLARCGRCGAALGGWPVRTVELMRLAIGRGAPRTSTRGQPTHRCCARQRSSPRLGAHRPHRSAWRRSRQVRASRGRRADCEPATAQCTTGGAHSQGACRIIHNETAKLAAEKLAVIEKFAQVAGVRVETLRQSDDHAWEQSSIPRGTIVMASHGRRGLSAAILGSQTHKVLTHSTIPVLVIR